MCLRGTTRLLRTAIRFERRQDAYTEVTGTVKSMLPHPMPISLMFWAGPGNEPALIKAASAYEEATHHRVPPKDFGPIPGEP